MSRALPEIAPSYAPIVAALLEGLDYNPEAVTPTMARRIERVAAELAGLEGLRLDVLRKARRLYEPDPVRWPLRLRDLPELYVELDRVWRKGQARIERADRERLERHGLYEGQYQ